MKAYDKLHEDIKDVAIINYIEETCFLWSDQHCSVRGTVARDFEDVVFLKDTSKKDRRGNELIEGDVIETKNNTLMLIKYGEYKMYCPADDLFESNIGFYIEATGYPQMPLGPTEDYAVRLGNIHTDKKIYLLRGEEENE